MKNIKKEYKTSKEIIDALEENDKNALKKTSYICYDDVIEFPQPCAFTIEHMKQIVKDADKHYKKKGKGLLVGMILKIPIPKEVQKMLKKTPKMLNIKIHSEKKKNVK